MKWFDKWFAKKCQQAWEAARPDSTPDVLASSGAIKAARLTTASEDWSNGLNITVNNANGGRIVQFRSYNNKTDRTNTTVYVIPESEDFNKELGKLITLESMRL